MKKSTAIKLCASVAGAYLGMGTVLYSAILTAPGVKLVAKINRMNEEKAAAKAPKKEEPAEKPVEQTAEKKLDWFHSAEHKTIFSYGPDGKRYQAVYFKNPNPSHLYFICCHGYISNPEGMGGYGEKMAANGFNILYPVLNGHGNSTRFDVTFGWEDRLIVKSFAEQIAARDPEAQIVIHGVSMGSVTVMNATGEALPPQVKCCLADCGFTTAYDQFSVQIGEILHLPRFPFVNAADIICRIRSKWNFKQNAPILQVAKSVTPTLFIHGDRDTFVPFWMQQALFEAASCEKEKLIVPEAEHANCANVNPELYWTTAEAFMHKYVDF